MTAPGCQPSSDLFAQGGRTAGTVPDTRLRLRDLMSGADHETLLKRARRVQACARVGRRRRPGHDSYLKEPGHFIVFKA